MVNRLKLYRWVVFGYATSSSIVVVVVICLKRITLSRSSLNRPNQRQLLLLRVTYCLRIGIGILKCCIPWMVRKFEGGRSSSSRNLHTPIKSLLCHVVLGSQGPSLMVQACHVYLFLCLIFLRHSYHAHVQQVAVSCLSP